MQSNNEANIAWSRAEEREKTLNEVLNGSFITEKSKANFSHSLLGERMANDEEEST